MIYTYNVYREDGTREDLTTRFEDVERLVKYLKFISVYVEDSINTTIAYWIKDAEALEMHRMMLERRIWQKNTEKVPHNFLKEEDGFSVMKQGNDAIATAVNPSHHKGFMVGTLGGMEIDLQWLEGQQLLPKYQDPDKFIAAVELQARKYLDRNGKKDAELQEFMKAKWYLDFIIAYIKNGKKPIMVADIPKLLAS